MSQPSDVRVRFAPSPTGMFHVGGARSALYNWAVAKQTGGRFVLRVEDTDAARNRPEWVQGIISALASIGISGEDQTFEGPYFQSAEAGLHKEACERLLASGHAYYEESTQVEPREPGVRYDNRHRDAGLDWAPGRALRFRTPDEGVTVVEDVVRGRVEFPNAAIEDFVIARGDGSPLFVLANVVDDMQENITHVIRAEEHLSNTPKQQLLWEALGRQAPVWAHLPVIVNEQRKKLSKRRDKVALEDYLAQGYLPEAMVNYLMLLGWGPGDDQEILPWDELQRRFRLEDVNSSAAFFDVKKLDAFNGEYVRALDVEEFKERCQPYLHAPHAPWDAQDFDEKVFDALAPLAQSRITVLSEITGYLDFAFLREPAFDEKSWTKAMKPGAEELLAAAEEAFAEVPWQAEAIKQALLAVGEARGLKLGKAQAPVRVAVTGRSVGLPLFESLEVLGRKRTLRRIAAARTKLAAA